MPTLIDALIEQGVLVCPTCRAIAWHNAHTVLHCQECGSDWPSRNQVLDLFNRYQGSGASATAAPSEVGGVGAGIEQADLAETIIETLDLSQHTQTKDKVAEIVRRASNWRCENAALTAEINDLLDRFAPEQRTIEPPPPPLDTNRGPRIRFVRHYLPADLPPGLALSANVRIENCGTTTLSSRVDHALVLRADWLRGRARTRPAEDVGEGSETRLPIDLPPGRALSLPLKLVAPGSPGRYGLRIALTWRASGEPIGEPLEVPIRLHSPRPGPIAQLRRRLTSGSGLAAQVVEYGPPIPDYGEDHAAGVRLIDAALKDDAKPGALILEVGSGTHPQLAWLTDYRVLALDISSPLLELGSLYFANRFRERLGFVCADAFNAPLAPASVDLVAMFSALHHFAEPERILARLAERLKPGGLLAVMCEPVGDSLEHPETLRDLLKGINEQVFSVDEYRRIFAKARLEPRTIRVDGASLKAILRRRP